MKTASNIRPIALLAVILLLAGSATGKKASGQKDKSLMEYVSRVQQKVAVEAQSSPGSLWVSGSEFANIAADYKARNVNDVIVINIVEQTLAEASGSVTSQRDFSASSGITALAGQVNTRGIEELFSPRSASKLQGKAQTASNSRMRTSVAGQVVAVLPNHSLVVEATREVTMNNQTQTILLRGVVRPGDVSPDNVVPSTALSNLEIELKGKGVISDGTRPPNFVVRLLLRILGF